MIRLGREKDSLNIVYDQIGVPAYARDIAIALLQVIDKIVKGKKGFRGIYHYAPTGVTCWFDYAKLFLKLKVLIVKSQLFLQPLIQHPPNVHYIVS